MGMVAAVKYLCPWSGCVWDIEFPYRPVEGIFPNPSEVERLVAAHLRIGHDGRVPDVVKGKPDGRQSLDARDLRCATVSRHGQPCVPREQSAWSSIICCRHCGQPT